MAMEENLSIVVVGVGGQGTLLASRILGHIALRGGLDVKVSEVHGMAQRGGSVITHIRMGRAVYAPLVEYGGADAVLAFEELEAARALPYLKEVGVLIASSQRVMPMPVLIGAAGYPADVLGIDLGAVRRKVIDAQSIAAGLGNPRVANVVLMGALARAIGRFTGDLWREAIRACVPPKTVAVNLTAFDQGYEIGAAM